MKRVLLFTLEYPPFMGGVGVHSYEMAKWARAAGVQVTVLAPDFGQDCSAFDSCQPFETLRFRGSGTKKEILSAIFHVFQSAHAGDYDFVFCTHMLAQLSMNILNWFVHYPFCITAYGSEVLYFSNTFLGRLLSYRLYQRAFAIVSFSDYTKNLICKEFRNVTVDNIFVEWPGVDRQRFEIPAKAIKYLREQLCILDTDFVLLTVARLDPRKGHDMVIRSVARLVLDGMDFIRYVIVGAGEYEGKLRELVQGLGLQAHVLFAGEVSYNSENLIGYYDMCDLFVLPSRQEGKTVEGFGIVFNEAAARGKPSIGSLHGGVVEAIVDGKTGILVNSNDSSELANVIRRLVDNPKLREEMGANGRRRVFSQLIWDQVAKRTYAGFLSRFDCVTRTNGCDLKTGVENFE
jgi:glycosyltransferase involved in cell wall biosynthesis